MTGAKSDRILMGPEAGVDFGVIKLNGCYMIVSSDPITGVASNVGWYAVNVSGNDVATSGNRPEFMESIIMLPEDSTEADLTKLADEMHRAADELGISIVGGHTELTPGLARPIIVVTAFSFVKGYVSSAGAQDGDKILMTKTAGLEGTAVLARESDRLGIRLGRSLVERAKRLEEQLSVVPEAVAAYGTGAVHGMHDCTEGGVLGSCLRDVARVRNRFRHEGTRHPGRGTNQTALEGAFVRSTGADRVRLLAHGREGWQGEESQGCLGGSLRRDGDRPLSEGKESLGQVGRQRESRTDVPVGRALENAGPPRLRRLSPALGLPVPISS